jgi:cold-inducible RNA-binding protein
MGRKLFVGNLPYEVGEAELQELFGKVGAVESVTIMRDMATGRARGFGFVEMGSDEDAQKAIAELAQAQLGGRTLTINEARPRPERGPGGGFGGGGGKGGGFGRNKGGRGGGGRREPRW